ncbi:MAG: outer membrane protein assembly factor BamB [Gammaproteobacteria bacterium]|nr:outer membrane protein assembly factor BamB [Gammaproteobacteria bacterium]
MIRSMLWRSVRILSMLILVLGLGGCGIMNWIHGGKSNAAPPAKLKSFAAAYRVERVWSADIGGGAGAKFIRLSPALHDGVLYVSEPHGQVRAYVAATGKKLWGRDLKNTEIEGGTGYADGMVLLGTRNGTVIALNATNGAPLWTASVSSEVLSPPRGADGIVVAQTVDGSIFGLSAKSGKQLWMQEHTVPALSLRGSCTPLIVDHVVVTGLANGKLAAYHESDGRQLWEIPVSEPHGRNEIARLVDVDAPPVVVGETLYADAYHGKLVAFNLASGRIQWSRDVSSYAGMAVDANNIYVSDARGYVTAYDLATGANVWQQTGLHGRWPTAPVVIGDTVAVGDFHGYVHFLSVDDGRFVARYRMGSAAILATPAADAETLYVADQDGDVVALRLHAKVQSVP